MKRRWILAVVAVALLARAATAQQPQLRTLREKASYSFGMSMGSTLKKQGVDIDVNLLMQGIKDATAGRTVLTEQQAMDAMQEFEKAMIAQQAAKSKQFMVENQRRPGVQTTKDGLQYKVLREGKGPRPKADDVVRVNYKAMFITGTEFESNGETPFTTPRQPSDPRLARRAATDARGLQVLAVHPARTGLRGRRFPADDRARTRRWSSSWNWSKSSSRPPVPNAPRRRPAFASSNGPPVHYDSSPAGVVSSPAGSVRCDSSSNCGISTIRTRPQRSVSSTSGSGSERASSRNSSLEANSRPQIA